MTGGRSYRSAGSSLARFSPVNTQESGHCESTPYLDIRDLAASWGGTARTDLCGGRQVTAVPTATVERNGSIGIIFGIGKVEDSFFEIHLGEGKRCNLR